MQRKKKQCKSCGQSCYYFSQQLCLQCYKIANPVVLKKTALKKSNKSVNKISSREKDRQQKYRLLRDEYLKANPLCEINVMGCTFKSVEIHHSSGRDGENLFKNFKATCRHCHDICENDPIFAKENGFSISRIKKQ